MLGRWSGPSWKRCSFSWTDFSIIELAFIHRGVYFWAAPKREGKALAATDKTNCPDRPATVKEGARDATPDIEFCRNRVSL